MRIFFFQCWGRYNCPCDFGELKGEITRVNEKLVQLTKSIQEKFEQQDNETTVFKRQEADLKKLDHVKDMTSLMVQLKSVIQTQKDAAEEVSDIKRQLNMVYGKKFFDRKK